MVSSYHANHELTIGILSIKILYNTNRFYNRLNRDPTPHTVSMICGFRISTSSFHFL